MIQWNEVDFLVHEEYREEASLFTINQICCWLNITQFVIFMTIEIFVLWKIRFTLDRSAVVTLSVYSLALLMRLLNWSVYLFTGRVPEERAGNIAVYMIDLLSSILIWATLYYFIFEMHIVRDKLQA